MFACARCKQKAGLDTPPMFFVRVASKGLRHDAVRKSDKYGT